MSDNDLLTDADLDDIEHGRVSCGVECLVRVLHELRRLREWTNPKNAYPFHVHAGRMGDDPWLTLCGRRVPRSSISCDYSATCPGCVAEGAAMIEGSDMRTEDEKMAAMSIDFLGVDG